MITAAGPVSTTALGMLCAPLPYLVAFAVDNPSEWLQLGLGGGALAILYFLIKPMVKGQIAMSRTLNETLVDMGKSNAASVEIQRQLLACAQTSADRELQTTIAINNLADKLSAHEIRDEFRDGARAADCAR